MTPAGQQLRHSLLRLFLLLQLLYVIAAAPSGALLLTRGEGYG